MKKTNCEARLKDLITCPVCLSIMEEVLEESTVLHEFYECAKCDIKAIYTIDNYSIGSVVIETIDFLNKPTCKHQLFLRHYIVNGKTLVGDKIYDLISLINEALNGQTNQS